MIPRSSRPGGRVGGLNEEGDSGLEHGEVGAGEGAEVVEVALAVEVAREDGEDGHDDAHDGEGVGHCTRA